MSELLPSHRHAALALLNGNYSLTRKAGQFLGQLVVDPSPLTEAQANWLSKLLTKHGLPPCEPSSAHECYDT